MIRHLGILSLLLILASGKPTTYDQRQDGGLNFHAQLDNIMIVIATPGEKGPSSLFNDIANQIIELKSLNSRNKKVSVENEEIVEQGKDPLSVKIVRIEREGEENVSQGQESLIQSGEPQVGVGEITIKTLKSSKIENTNTIPEKELKKEEIPEILKKKISSNNQEILADLGISNKIKQIETKAVENSEKVESPKRDLPQEKPEKIEDVKTIKSTPKESEIKEITKLDKKLSEQIIPHKSEEEKINLEEKKSKVPEIQAKNLDNQEIIKQEEKSSENIGNQEKIHEDKKIAVHSEDKIVPKSRRVQRELKISLNDPHHLPIMKEEEEAGDKNEVHPFSPQLKPIGNMIENCGPGRIRNKYGICQFDESFN